MTALEIRGNSVQMKQTRWTVMDDMSGLTSRKITIRCMFPIWFRVHGLGKPATPKYVRNTSAYMLTMRDPDFRSSNSQLLLRWVQCQKHLKLFREIKWSRWKVPQIGDATRDLRVQTSSVCAEMQSFWQLVQFLSAPPSSATLHQNNKSYQNFNVTKVYLIFRGLMFTLWTGSHLYIDVNEKFWKISSHKYCQVSLQLNFWS